MENGMRTPFGVILVFSVVILIVYNMIYYGIYEGYSNAGDFLFVNIEYLIGGGFLVFVSAIVAGIYSYMGPFFIVLNILFGISAYNANELPHIGFYCGIVKGLGVHHFAVEWFCALVTAFGWIRLSD